MAEFDKINIDAVSYKVKDTTARQQIADISIHALLAESDLRRSKSFPA